MATNNIMCAGPGPHQPASGILGQSDQTVTGMLCPSTACQAAPLAAQAATAVAAGNQATIQTQAAAALAANATDKTQDQNIISQAAGVIAAPPTTLAAMTPVIKALAQAVNTLAQNDLNTKAELNALIRLALGKFDATS